MDPPTAEDWRSWLASGASLPAQLAELVTFQFGPLEGHAPRIESARGFLVDPSPPFTAHTLFYLAATWADPYGPCPRWHTNTAEVIGPRGFLRLSENAPGLSHVLRAERADFSAAQPSTWAKLVYNSVTPRAASETRPGFLDDLMLGALAGGMGATVPRDPAVFCSHRDAGLLSASAVLDGEGGAIVAFACYEHVPENVLVLTRCECRIAGSTYAITPCIRELARLETMPGKGPPPPWRG